VKPLTADERAKEHAILQALGMDVVMVSALLATGIFGGSLTMLAEGVRGFPGFVLECFSLVLLRRIHRGTLVDMEYGSGKVEQVGNLFVGVSMLIASVWIIIGVVGMISGTRQVGTPLGLACAAVIGMVNVYINLVAWDAVRRATARDRSSLIMQGQLTIRRVKLFASVIVVTGLTVAALSTDDVVVAWADGIPAAFVACYLVVSSIEVLRGAVPDLLDRSAGAGVRRVVSVALANHAASFAGVNRFRSRRSGHVTFVEIALTVARELKMSEVEERVASLERDIKGQLENAEIVIVTTAAPPSQMA
jgi:divalent metal cation (Fe/Co/Zn/Cd) transporter